MVSEPEGDRLYALPLEQFTPARDALAARLRSAGDAEEAARVKALRKPTTPAWAVNQLVRRARDRVEELIASSERLRRAQQELLHGGPAQDVWEATLAERETLAALTDEAERALTEAGYGAPRSTLERISDTLAAAAADVGGRTLLRRGILTNEMRRAGFDSVLSDADADGEGEPAPKPAPPKSGGATSRQRLDAEREATRLERVAARAEADAERFEKAAAKAADDAASAKRRLATVEKEAAAARADAASARKEAAAARREADRAKARLAKPDQTRRSR